MSTKDVRSLIKVLLGFWLMRALVNLLTKPGNQRVLPRRSHDTLVSAKVLPLRRRAAVRKTIASPVSNAKLAARK